MFKNIFFREHREIISEMCQHFFSIGLWKWEQIGSKKVNFVFLKTAGSLKLLTNHSFWYVNLKTLFFLMV